MLIEDRNFLIPVPCKQLFDRVHVTAEGYLDACCFDFDSLTAIEDLHNMTLLEAWYGKRMRELRRQHLNGNLGPNRCRCCVYGEPISKIKPINEELVNLVHCKIRCDKGNIL